MNQGALSGSRTGKEHWCTPTTKPNSSLVKVESIYINIAAAEQIKPEKCEHFTIRGFVSVACEQNGKQCWPFSVDGTGAGYGESNVILHSLHAPHFKSWRCQSCLSEIDAEAAKKEGHNNNANCRRQLKTKTSLPRRSLGNVVAYLSEKLKQPSGLGRTVTVRNKSVSELTQKQKQKQDSDLCSSTRRLGKNGLHDAANGFISNRQVSLTDVDREQQNGALRPHKTTTTKFVIGDGSRHRGKHDAGTELIQQRYDDSVGTFRRKIKAKKVRLLDEILDKEGKGAHQAANEGFHLDESGKAGCGGSQSLQKIQFENVRSQESQKMKKKHPELDSKWSQMHHADSVDGNANGSASAMTSKVHRSGAVNIQTDKMLFEKEQRADSHTDYPEKGQEQLLTCQPFHGRLVDSLHNSRLPHSQFKGISAIHKSYWGANVLALPDNNNKVADGNNVPQKLVETIHIGNQTQYFQPIQDGHSSKHHYPVADGFLDTGKGAKYWIAGSGNRSLTNDTTVYMGETSSACKSLDDKNARQDSITNSNAALKGPNLGRYGGNKKLKYCARAEGGPTVVHQTELLIGNSNKKRRILENPEITHSKIKGNVMQAVGDSDDIPMEIVELMAKNQYERRLHDVGKHGYMQQSCYNQKSDLVGSTSMPQTLHGKPHLPTSRMTSGKNSGIANGKHSYETQRPSTESIHRPVLSSQWELSGVLQLPAVGSSKSDIYQIQNGKHDMNKPAIEQTVPSRSQAQFELWKPTYKKTDKTDHEWPIVAHNNPARMPNVLQGNAFPHVLKFSGYVAEGQAYNFRPEASYTSRPNRVESRSQVMGSPDPYANEAIQAMRLLSLMNGRPQSCTPTNMDTVASRKTFDRSFSNDHLAKELSGNNFAVGKSSQKLKQPSSSGYHSKNPQSDATCQCSPPVPAFSSVAASLHGDIGGKINSKTSSQHQERAISNRSPGGSQFSCEKPSIKYQKPPLTSTTGPAFQQFMPTREITNHSFSPSWSVRGSSHLYINGNFNKYCNLVPHESFDTLNKRAEPGVCYVNRNPMEFTIPGPGNEFMIGPEELKLGIIYPPNITRPMTTNVFKQQGFIKYATPNRNL